jgi:hypothetical protein
VASWFNGEAAIVGSETGRSRRGPIEIAHRKQFERKGMMRSKRKANL